ncbi:MAG: GTPase obg [Parcubacteria group bacterium GW2011_GWE2_37_8]|nr:MAG: GTPase obg [Parcubacteria group bacterium GW2011_GWE2_37_8]
MTQRKHGKDGDDLILVVPNGTVIHNFTTGEDVEIMDENPVLLVKGGKGGRGNYTFKSSVNTTPRESTPGLNGESAELFLELRLIADIGLIGLPNVGKSSLLNELTKANVKVANYHFTTLEPSLGAYKNVILADIPGLIEGAAEGKGLGHKFLKHIKRTKAFFHLISADSKDVAKDYKTIRKELGKFEEFLLEKIEYVFISRTDLVSEKELKEKIKILKKLNKNTGTISIYDPDAMEKIEKLVLKFSKQ